MDKELIGHIAKTLKQHQEPYADGAWERFAKKGKKRRTIAYWPMWSAAAVILVAVGFILYLNKVDIQIQTKNLETSANKTIVSAKKDMTTEDHKKSINQTFTGENQIAIGDQKSNSNPIEKGNIANRQPNKTSLTLNPLEISENQDAANNQNAFAQANQNILIIDTNLIKPAAVNTIASTTDKISTPVAEPQKKSFEDILERDSKAAEKVAANNKKTDSKNKWQPGVYVGPAMGNDNKVQMNYGFSLSYALADKISINSGIAYNSLSATENTDASRPQTLSDRSLAAVNANLRGINIPLEVKYNFTDNFYSGVGVSALAVLNNAQQNSYIVNSVQQVASYSDAGALQNKTLIVAQRTTEAAPSTNNLDKYIGFYNFSLGYKQKLSKKTSFALEPFLRLPMKPISNENLNLTNGGLKLMFGF